MALLSSAFTEGDRRNHALGYWGPVGSPGAIVGQLLSRVLTTAYGWRANILGSCGLVRVRLAHSAPSDRPLGPELVVEAGLDSDGAA